MWPITESGSRPKKPSLGLSAHAAPLSALRRFCITPTTTTTTTTTRCATTCQLPRRRVLRAACVVLCVLCAYHARVEPRRTRALVNVEPRKFIVHRSTTRARFVTRVGEEEEEKKREGENGVSEEER